MADEQTETRNLVSLPSGSFELRDLSKALDSAVSVKDREKWPERINAAIAETIVQPEILANYAAPSVPTGATLREQEIDYGNGYTAKREVLSFDGVDAESGEEAAGMKYAENRAGDETVAVAADEPALPLAGEAPAPSLAAAAEEVVGAGSSTSSSSTGKSNK